ncbi:MAG: lytic transglycosylase domain-containing protein [Alphaproteobacteria bacterium]
MQDTGRRVVWALRSFGAGIFLSGIVTISASAGPSPAVGPRAQAQAPAQSEPLTQSEPVSHDILGESDAGLYADIFRFQQEGQYARASELTAQLGDRVLVGHVLAERYLDRTRYKVKYAELVSWLDAYADHPQASDIYALAQKLHPKGKALPHKPTTVKIRSVYEWEPDLVPARGDVSGRRKVANIQRSVKRYLYSGKPSSALKVLETPKALKDLTAVEADEMRQWIAAGFFFAHVDDRAFEIAHAVAERRRAAVPMADWIAGLSAWRLGKVESAARHFEELAGAQRVGPWLRSGAAYWAARANLVAGVPERVTENLKVAARTPKTFYGLLAQRQLGVTPNFNWDPPRATEEEVAQALSLPAVKRAVALSQVGEIENADLEMRRAHAVAPSNLDRALICLAAENQLAAAQLHVAETSAAPGLEGALYPIPAYKPQNGFTIDPALLYAFMRQESRFKPQAKSTAGASGLMQIMPATAALVGRDRSLKKRNRARLYDPSYNLRLAQTYIEQLLKVTEPRGNLFMLAVAYNGGPGNLRKWYGKMEIQDDPLLFIESLPSRETRNYVERVVANLWIYHYRMNRPPASLDMVASGAWPVYEGPDSAPGSTVSLGRAAAGAMMSER